MKTSKNAAGRLRRNLYWVGGLFILYLTVMIIRNATLDFHFGEIDFSKESIDRYANLVGVIVGIVGTVLLIETFWLQYRIYREEQKNKEVEELKELYNILKLLSFDLKRIFRDINRRLEYIPEYFTSKREDPFNSVKLRRTVSKDYFRIMQLDRQRVFRALSIFSSGSTEWLENYGRMFSLVDFFTEMFDEMYSDIDGRDSEITALKMTVRDDLVHWLSISHTLKARYKDSDNSHIRNICKAIDQATKNYEDIVGGKSEITGLKEETPLNRIPEEVLLVFNRAVIEFNLFRPDLYRQMNFSLKIINDIELIEGRSIEVANDLRSQYDKLNRTSSPDLPKSPVEEFEVIMQYISELVSSIDFNQFVEAIRHRGY